MIPLIEQVRQFPKKPGVYLMKDKEGRTIYVGKAKNLRARVLSYFQKPTQKERYQIGFLMRKVCTLETIVTDNEKEALLLENTLIKEHQPRYNLFLKDDKSYVSLKLSEQHPFPGLFITHKILKDGSLYFGPYTSATALRETVHFLTRHFQLRTCNDREFANRSRPCLEHDMKRCSAPCVAKIAQADYRQQVEAVKLFLQGKKTELIPWLQTQMQKASESQGYEEAARCRDMLAYMKATREAQKAVQYGKGDYDAVGIAQKNESAAVVVLTIRQGILLDQKRFVFLRAVGTPEELLEQFIFQHYGTVLEMPPQIFVSAAVPLERIKERPVAIKKPRRGLYAKMVALAVKNAAIYLNNRRVMDIESFLESLQNRLELQTVPRTIECVDISNLQGKQAVGSLVAFTDGEPDKSRYRKFKIRLPEEPNDYAMMREVLSRRLTREGEKWVWPDLLMVDGGKGHLAVAVKVLADLGAHSLPVVAIAKEKEKREADKIYLPGRMNPVNLKIGAPELLYLMRIRDEAHRFGIAYHRQLRSKNLLASQIEKG